MRLIKKYPNRKFYDTTLHRYVNLPEIREYVKNKTNFQVFDTKTQQDITNQVIFDTFVPVLRGKLDAETLVNFCKTN